MLIVNHFTDDNIIDINLRQILLQTLQEKDTLELRVKVTGAPQPKVQWYCDDKELHPTLKVQVKEEEDGVHTLVITGVKQNLSGHYKAIAVNAAGQTEHIALIAVSGKLLLYY